MAELRSIHISPPAHISQAVSAFGTLPGKLAWIAAAACLVSLAFSLPNRVMAAPQRLEVSENGRFLVDGQGQPFFWLGDTAWELFHRLNREEADRYLEDRAAKGFTVVQSVALAELDGLNDPNPYGHRPLINNDPTRPDVKEGPHNDYWDHVDYIVNKANSLGIMIGFLPTWGDKWNKKWGVGPEIFTPDNAEKYGQWLGQRYRDAGLVWILGGDRPIENDTQREIIRRMALGLHKGDGGSHLTTFHPTGGSGSAQYFHNAPWLDFNMRKMGMLLSSRDDTIRREWTTIGSRSSRCWMASRFMKTIPYHSSPKNLGTRSLPTCAGRSIGISSVALVDTRTDTTRSGRCGRPVGVRSIIRFSPGLKRSASRGPARCNLDAGFWNRGRCSRVFPTPPSS